MAERKMAKKGDVFQDTDSRMNGRKLVVIEVKKQHKAVGRFKRGHYYATCRVRHIIVKVDEARLFSSAYRLIATPTPVIASDACESVENCGCAPTQSPTVEASPALISDEIISPA